MKKILFAIISLLFLANFSNAQTEETNATSKIEYLYKTVLNREADEGGLKYWSEVLKNGEKSENEIILFFFRCEEFSKRRIGDEEFITTAFKAFLKREPSEEELKSFLSEAKPLDREEVLKKLLQLKEEQKAKKDLIPIIEIVKMQNATPFWTNGEPAKLVILDGSKSVSKNSKINQYIWREHNCNGNVIGSGKKISLYYMQEGNYKVALEIVDKNGTRACAVKSFEVKGIKKQEEIPPQNIIIRE